MAISAPARTAASRLAVLLAAATTCAPSAFGDLAAGLSDAAAGAEHEDFVGGFDVATFDQRMPDRAVDERKN
jgi:hypothetical protein